jgi:hypothetical protein
MPYVSDEANADPDGLFGRISGCRPGFESGDYFAGMVFEPFFDLPANSIIVEISAPGIKGKIGFPGFFDTSEGKKIGPGVMLFRQQQLSLVEQFSRIRQSGILICIQKLSGKGVPSALSHSIHPILRFHARTWVILFMTISPAAFSALPSRAFGHLSKPMAFCLLYHP